MNPETKKLKQRVVEYKRTHPRYRENPSSDVIRRKKMNTRKRLKPGTRCAYCGKLLSTYTATIDHIVPLSRGGDNEPSNLCWCCKNCNSEKAYFLTEEWKCT